MTRFVRSLTILVAGALLLSACGLIPLPGPVEVDTAFGFGDGVPVELTAVAAEFAAVAPALVPLATDFSGPFNEVFVVDSADIPSILKTLVRIQGVSETITLGSVITVTNPTQTTFPAEFTVSDASISGLNVYRGTTKVVGPLDFAGIAGAEFEYVASGACVDSFTCTYAADFPVDLMELGVSGGVATSLAKAIADGGTFRVEGTFAIVIDPGLPADATASAVIVGTGAFIE